MTIFLEKNKIRNVLLNKNKIKYLNRLEDELYQNGLDLKKIKISETDKLGIMRKESRSLDNGEKMKVVFFD